MKDLVGFWTKQKIINKREAEAFLATDRADFIPKDYLRYAYVDEPLPIGKYQTISQPTTVAVMTHALKVKDGQKILEVGSGSGWQAAILSRLAGKSGEVVTIERIKELYKFAKDNLKGYKNVKVVWGDGYKGCKKEAPFDRIILTSAPRSVPEELKNQLKVGGILLAPVGSYFQDLIRLKKTKSGFRKETLGAFRFVPMLEGKEP